MENELSESLCEGRRSGLGKGMRVGAKVRRALVLGRGGGEVMAGRIMRIIHASTSEELERISGEIHDELFNVDWVKHDVENRVVEVPFVYELGTRRKLARKGIIRRQWRIPLRKGILRFRDVGSACIHDRSKIGFYTLDRLNYEAERSQLVLTTCEDSCITMEVSSLDVELQLLDEDAGEREVSYILGVIESGSHRAIRLCGPGGSASSDE